MARIFKWQLQVQQREMLQVPQGARFISVAEQNEQLVLYGIVTHENAPLSPRIIRIATTGDEFVEEAVEFIGTAILRGWFVAHVFEQRPGVSDPVNERWKDDFRAIRLDLQPD